MRSSGRSDIRRVHRPALVFSVGRRRRRCLHFPPMICCMSIVPATAPATVPTGSRRKQKQNYMTDSWPGRRHFLENRSKLVGQAHQLVVSPPLFNCFPLSCWNVLWRFSWAALPMARYSYIRFRSRTSFVRLDLLFAATDCFYSRTKTFSWKNDELHHNYYYLIWKSCKKRDTNFIT